MPIPFCLYRWVHLLTRHPHFLQGCLVSFLQLLPLCVTLVGTNIDDPILQSLVVQKGGHLAVSPWVPWMNVKRQWFWKPLRPGTPWPTHLGPRGDETLALQWEQADFKENVIVVLSGKGGKARRAPLDHTRRNVLLSLKPASGPTYVLGQGDKPYSRACIRIDLNHLGMRAGLADRDVKLKAARTAQWLASNTNP